MSKKILIVGGVGFIGHNLALKFIKDGFDVTVVDSLSVNNLSSVMTTKIIFQTQISHLILLMKELIT